MVSITWAIVSLSSGLLAYILGAVIANSGPITLRQKVGTFYYQLAVRSLQRPAIVERMLGGLELRRFDMDDEHKVGKVTLDSGLLGGDKTMEFTDPAGCVHLLYDKPVAVLVEGIPAAVDADLAELGYWKREKDLVDGFETIGPDGQVTAVNPYVEVDTRLRTASPVDVSSLLMNTVDPEDIQAMREITKKRYEKYGSNIGMAETFSLAVGYGIGIGSVAILEYVRVQLLDQQPAGSGGGGFTPPIPPGQIVGPDLAEVTSQLVVVLL